MACTANLAPKFTIDGKIAAVRADVSASCWAASITLVELPGIRNLNRGPFGRLVHAAEQTPSDNDFAFEPAAPRRDKPLQ